MKVIAIDGIDCVGKQTQCKLLKNYLISLGYNVKLLSFPNYDIATGKKIMDYLSGKLDLGVFEASKLYTDNRVETFKAIDLDDYDYLIIDRYTTANIIHQGVKFITNSELIHYIKDLLDLEYNKMKLLKPDINIILNLNVETSNKLLQERGNKVGRFEDKHETDLEYRIKVSNLVSKLSNYIDCEIIDCNNESNDNIRSASSIHLDILKVLGRIDVKDTKSVLV